MRVALRRQQLPSHLLGAQRSHLYVRTSSASSTRFKKTGRYASAVLGAGSQMPSHHKPLMPGLVSRVIAAQQNLSTLHV
jgi:hypothetical protein